MSIQALSWVIEHAEAQGSELLVLLMIANHAHADGTGSYPGERLLARESRVSERQVRRILKQLVARVVLAVDADRSRFGTKVYRIVGMANRAPDVVQDSTSPGPGIGSTATGHRGRARPDTATSDNPSSIRPYTRQEPRRETNSPDAEAVASPSSNGRHPDVRRGPGILRESESSRFQREYAASTKAFYARRDRGNTRRDDEEPVELVARPRRQTDQAG